MKQVGHFDRFVERLIYLFRVLFHKSVMNGCPHAHVFLQAAMSLQRSNLVDNIARRGDHSY